jgi:hypothetical protein
VLAGETSSDASVGELTAALLLAGEPAEIGPLAD